MLFNELRRHGKLAAKRHPMYEKNKIGKYIMYASFIFWGAYFIFIGIGLAKAISTEVPNMEAYHILNSGLIFALALDFVIRFPFQKTPTQNEAVYSTFCFSATGSALSILSGCSCSCRSQHSQSFLFMEYQEFSLTASAFGY